MGRTEVIRMSMVLTVVLDHFNPLQESILGMVLGACKVQNVLSVLISMQGVAVDGESSQRRMSKM